MYICFFLFELVGFTLPAFLNDFGQRLALLSLYFLAHRMNAQDWYSRFKRLYMQC